MPRVIITVPGKSPQPYRFQLDRHAVSLGRGSNNDIVIDCGSVSVSHAVMRRVEGGFELADLQSTNGVKLDGERRELVTLQNGISLEMGDVTFEFQLSDEELEAMAHENAAPKLPPLPKPEPDSAAETGSGQKHKKQQRAHQPNSGGLVWPLILILIAFCVGMAIRFNKETGGNWLKAVISRVTTAASDGG